MEETEKRVRTVNLPRLLSPEERSGTTLLGQRLGEGSVDERSDSLPEFGGLGVVVVQLLGRRLAGVNAADRKGALLAVGRKLAKNINYQRTQRSTEAESIAIDVIVVRAQVVLCCEGGAEEERTELYWILSW